MLVGAKRIVKAINLGGTAGSPSSRPIVDGRFFVCGHVIASGAGFRYGLRPAQPPGAAKQSPHKFRIVSLEKNAILAMTETTLEA
jgi:hypothetical protein